MADYLDTGLRAIQKSLGDVVLPALDPADPLAREQLALTIDYLGFLRQRIDHILPQLRFELDHYRAMARQLTALEGAADIAAPLRDALARTEAVGEDVWTTATTLRSAIDALAGAIDDMVATAAGSDLRSAVDRVVHERTAHWIAFEQSWYRPIAVDPDAPGIAPLESFFGANRADA